MKANLNRNNQSQSVFESEHVWRRMQTKGSAQQHSWKNEWNDVGKKSELLHKITTTYTKHNSRVLYLSTHRVDSHAR
jgi:hypothetical protein